MKKDVFIPVLLIILGLLFVAINIIVFISGGNTWFIGRKLKVGAMILSLTGIFACGYPPKPSCYEQPPTKEYKDSIANARKQDSIQAAEKQKHIDDSVAKVTEQKIKDSLAKIKHKKKPPVVEPTCYKVPPQKTCYAPVKKQPE